MKPSTKYDVFISYSRLDYVDKNKGVIPNNIVSKIKDTFEQEKISYWFDEDGIYSGDVWAKELPKRIEECLVFLFISSANSNQSEWTGNEIATAHMFKKHIIPFRIDNSVFNRSVIIYIAKLDYIDYHSNPDTSIPRLVDSIKKLVQEKKKEEELLIEKKKKEEEEIKKIEDAKLQSLIRNIEANCHSIVDYESKSEHSRGLARSLVRKINNEEQRLRFINLIDNSGCLFTEKKKLERERDELSKKVLSLQKEVEEKDKQILEHNANIQIWEVSLQSELSRHNEYIELLVTDKNEAEAERAQLVQERCELVDTISSLQTQLAQLAEERDKFADTISSLQKEKGEFTAQLNIIKRKNSIFGLIIIGLSLIILIFLGLVTLF